MKTNSSIRISALTLLFLILCISLWSFNVTDSEENTVATSKIYCELYVRNQLKLDRTWSYTISVGYGNHSNYSATTTEYEKVKSFTNYLDALNYLGARGWRLIMSTRHHIDYELDYEDNYILEKTIN